MAGYSKIWYHGNSFEAGKTYFFAVRSTRGGRNAGISSVTSARDKT